MENSFRKLKTFLKFFFLKASFIWLVVSSFQDMQFVWIIKVIQFGFGFYK